MTLDGTYCKVSAMPLIFEQKYWCNIQWFGLENQQRPFYVVNEDTQYIILILRTFHFDLLK